MQAKGELGDRIRAARHAKGWKQKHLAAQVSVEPITVSRWERGATTPDLEVLGLVAEATGRPLSFFVDDQSAGTSDGDSKLADAAVRVEAAAARVSEESERIAILLSELLEELRDARARA